MFRLKNDVWQAAGFLVGLLVVGGAEIAVARPPNYDEAKVAPYVLEDPLTFADGTKLADASQWPLRRAEIVRIFEKEMFGRTPPKPDAVVTELLEEGQTLSGQAIRRQYRMWFRTEKTGPFIDWLVVIPNCIAGDDPGVKDGKVICENKKRVPVVLLLNYCGNHEMLTDPEVLIPEGDWVRDHARRFGFGSKEGLAAGTRGRTRMTDNSSPLPIETIVARGYALVTACYGQVSPDVDVRRGDPEDKAYTGIFALWPKRNPQEDDNITSIGAWAWALSRGLDLAERIPEIDARKSVATGCSRLAKTALLAASRDERFAVCVPCQTGGGGCPLAKRDYGENVSTEMKAFPHWYCRAYGKYVDNEQMMSFDQHLLLASIAPRALLVEGYNSRWFDTKGEYLACRAAASAWTFLGLRGLSEGDFPENYDTSLIGERFGYVRRGGSHGISGSDWMWMLDFADLNFSRVAGSDAGDVRNWDEDFVVMGLGVDAAENRRIIQGAIDRANARGEGRVSLPTGVWISASLELKSGVELHLPKGAVLKGSACRRDYNANDAFPENKWSDAEEWSGGHLVWARCATNVAITGEGTIDGNGPAFFGECDEDSRWPYYRGGLKLHPTDRGWFRPGMMVAFFRCRDVRISGVTLARTPAWTCHLRCCDGVDIRNVTIDADRTIANSDGFSIDCTRNVRVEGCMVRSGDDGFAIRASCERHADANFCENIVITNCDIWSYCYGIRFGVGTGTIRNIEVVDTRIHEAAEFGIGFTPAWISQRKDCWIEDVVVRNCRISDCVRPVGGGPSAGDSHVTGIRFADCIFNTLLPIKMVGGSCCEVSFSNCVRHAVSRFSSRHRRGWHEREIKDAESVFAEIGGDVSRIPVVDCRP